MLINKYKNGKHPYGKMLSVCLSSQTIFIFKQANIKRYLKRIVCMVEVYRPYNCYSIQYPQIEIAKITSND